MIDHSWPSPPFEIGRPGMPFRTHTQPGGRRIERFQVAALTPDDDNSGTRPGHALYGECGRAKPGTDGTFPIFAGLAQFSAADLEISSRLEKGSVPSVPTFPAAGTKPTVSTAARAAASVPPGSTACACAAFPYSRKGVAVRFLPGCESSPACAGATPVAASPAAPGPDSTTSESGLPPPASECGPRPACPSSACARNWPGSAPRPRSRSRPQILDQLHEPLAVARGFHADQHRRRQLLIEQLGIARGMHQPPFPAIPGLRVQPTHLLPAGMEITSYNHHCEGSFLPSLFVLKQRLHGPESSLRSYPISPCAFCKSLP